MVRGLGSILADVVEAVAGIAFRSPWQSLEHAARFAIPVRLGSKSLGQQQIIELVRGVQKYLNIGNDAEVEKLKNELSKAQSADTKAAVATIKTEL